ncbi:MAG: hypothetical protein ABUL58_03800 [Steroidobacter sp.]
MAQSGRNNRRKLWIGIAFLIALFAMLWAFTQSDDQQKKSADKSLPVSASSSAPNILAAVNASSTSVSFSSISSILAKHKGMEVCGIGHVDIDPDDDKAVNAYFGKITSAARSRWKASIINHDSPGVRELGLYLQYQDAQQHGNEHDRNEALNSLASWAAEVNDPVVYGIAYNVCSNAKQSLPDDNACHQLSLVKWTEMDSDNAAPWLLLADEEQQHNHVDSSMNAFVQAGKAQKFDSYGYALAEVAQKSFPKDMSPLEQSLLSDELFGELAAWSEHSYQSAGRRCTGNMTNDKLRQICSSLAEILTNHSRGLLDVAVGKRIASEAGWPQYKLDAITEKLHALMATLWLTSNGGMPLDQEFDYHRSKTCGAIKRENDYLAKVAQMGEREALLEYLKNSGKTAEELAQLYLDVQRKIQKESSNKQ